MTTPAHWEKGKFGFTTTSEHDATITDFTGNEHYRERSAGNAFASFSNSYDVLSGGSYHVGWTTHDESDNGTTGDPRETDAPHEENSSTGAGRYVWLGQNLGFAGLTSTGILQGQETGIPLQLHHPGAPEGGELPTITAKSGGQAEAEANFESGQGQSGALGFELYAGLNLDLLHEYCFFENEPIVLADGTEKFIQHMQAGDRVAAALERDPNGAISAYPVVQRYDNGLRHPLYLHLEDERGIATKGKGERLDRPELELIESELRKEEIDVFIFEDLGRLVRGTEAVRLLGIAVDHGTRVIVPNDCIDTADETWEEDAIAACRDHVGHNAHTSKRLKHKLMNRFKKFGGAMAREIAGYIVADDAKTYDDWQKDPTAEFWIHRGATLLRETGNYSAVADLFNRLGIPLGPYCRRKPGTARWFAAFTPTRC